jgi:hypothetical protein
MSASRFRYSIVKVENSIHLVLGPETSALVAAALEIVSPDSFEAAKAANEMSLNIQHLLTEI